MIYPLKIVDLSDLSIVFCMFTRGYQLGTSLNSLQTIRGWQFMVHMTPKTRLMQFHSPVGIDVVGYKHN